MTDTAPDQCPTCGRVSEDWGANRDPEKVRQRSDQEDRLSDYRRWRWRLGAGCFVSDIDQVEWRLVEGQIAPAMVLEMTRLDGDAVPSPSYLQAIIDRFTKRDGQGLAVCEIARRLGVDAVIVLFRHDLTEVWLYNLSTSIGWHHGSFPTYEKWIRELRGAA